jgi:hypothetical protein
MSGHQTMAQALVQTGKSYVNITKGVSGGTIEPGDVLEIRATISVGRLPGNPVLSISRVHFVDTIPANTTYVAGSLRILTNEGLTFRTYTDAGNDDAAMYNNTAPRTVRINLGSSISGAMGTVINSTVPGGTTGGTIHHQGRPSFYGGTCILSASYRIRVNPAAVYGTTINMFGGAFLYRNNGIDSVRRQSPYRMTLTQNLGLCANSIGANAIIDNGGTFGSGTTQNRTLSAIVPGYTFAAVAGGMPNDGSYAIVNNMSPTGSTNVNSPKPDPVNPQRRVFRMWDIMGDHTGAAVPAAGNAPVAPGTNGGYFVAINASYANSNAIQQTVGGLCPNTYYEFSAWFKNICQYCACDSTGDAPYNINTGAGTATPNTAFNGPDSSGVNPNLTFTIDGTDYYTSGTMLYTGQWVKKGFIYLTGPTQTSFTLTIRNNAAGGGGNDWAIDDVTLATCTPNLNMQPSPMVPVCYGNQVDIAAIIRCFFPNYTNYRWERSTDNGVTWANTGVAGIGTPAMVAGEWQYTAAYPSFLGDSSVHNNIYRIRLASTAANLSNPNCSFLATTLVRVMVNSCSEVLHGDIQSFSGNVANSLATLYWTVSGDYSSGTIFEVESSNDNTSFEKVGEVVRDQGRSNYQFTDSRPLAATRYYRLRLTNGQSHKYSKVISLSNGATIFTVRSLVNPFDGDVSFELVSPEDAAITITLRDAYGRVMKTVKEPVNAGVNSMQLNNLAKLPAGVYILQIQWKDKLISKRLVKGEK